MKLKEVVMMITYIGTYFYIVLFEWRKRILTRHCGLRVWRVA